MARNSIEEFRDTFTNLVLAEFNSLEEGISTLSEKTGISGDKLISFIKGNDIPTTHEAIKLAKNINLINNDSMAKFGFLQIVSDLRKAKEDEDKKVEAAFSAVETKEETDNNSNNTDVAMASKEEAVEPSEANSMLQRKIEELEARCQELSKQQQVEEQYREITTMLYALQHQASAGIEEGWLPPVVCQKLFSSINSPNPVASFSSYCAEKDIDPYVEAYAIFYTIQLFKELANNEAMFTSFSNENNNANFSSTESKQVKNELDDEELLEKIAENSFKWFKESGQGLQFN